MAQRSDRSRSQAAGSSALVLTGDRQAAIAVVGQVANEHAAANAFANYRSRKAPQTLRRHDAALSAFAYYLAVIHIPADAEQLASEPAAWQGMTWGIVAGFAAWLLKRGYAIGTVNDRVSVVKIYAKLAQQAGAIDATEWNAIHAIRTYGHTEGKNVDSGRPKTRVGAKKAQPVSLDERQAQALKAQPDTPQGRRDRLIVCLLLDHGLRAGELAGLQVTDLDVTAGELRFHRPKVNKTQIHRLTRDALAAARAYVDSGDALGAGPLFRQSRRGAQLAEGALSAVGISERVRRLGEAIGVAGLSAHDLRHSWATRAARNGTPIDRLQDAGGWNSPAMPLRYVEAAKVANEGVRV